MSRIQLQRSVTGELIAFDIRKRVIVASGFDDEDDFNEWLRKYERELSENIDRN